jgi:hypothetical protein
MGSKGLARGLGLGGLAVALAAGACELVVSPASLQDQQCGPGLKLCPLTAGGTDLSCVSVESPEYGCASTSCTPCLLPNAQADCDPTGKCAILSCVETTNAQGNPIAIWYNCNGIESDGCESNTLEDPDNCGVCGHACPTLHAAPSGVLCEQGLCQANECLPGFSTCDGGSGTCVSASSCNDGG